LSRGWHDWVHSRRGLQNKTGGPAHGELLDDMSSPRTRRGETQMVSGGRSEDLRQVARRVLPAPRDSEARGLIVQRRTMGLGRRRDDPADARVVWPGVPGDAVIASAAGRTPTRQMRSHAGGSGTPLIAKCQQPSELFRRQLFLELRFLGRNLPPGSRCAREARQGVTDASQWWVEVSGASRTGWSGGLLIRTAGRNLRGISYLRVRRTRARWPSRDPVT